MDNDAAVPVTRSGLWEMLYADAARFSGQLFWSRDLLRGIVSQGFLAIVVYRMFRWCYERSLPSQPMRFFAERIIEMTSGISIPVQVRIGKGLRIHHFGGIMIHPDTRIGEQCTLYHGVTLGDLGGSGGAPTIGSRVTIGAGAKVLGNVHLGDDVFVGANAVVLRSVPPNCIAVGVPAVNKPRGNPST